LVPSSRRLLLAAALAALGPCTFVTACGGEESSEPAPKKISEAKFEPSKFGHPATGANPYFPLKPGTQWVREGSTREGSRRVPHQVTVTVTDVYREINGVRTVVVLDYELDAGQVSQESLDYFAEDKDGNVWDLGGYTEEIEGGQFVAAVDAWLAGINSSKAGLLVQADPSVANPVYAIAQPAGKEADVAEVVKVGVNRCVAFGCFKDVLVVREGKESAPDNEFKYYARGVGQIDNVPKSDSTHRDVEELVNLTQLSPRALAEASAEVLRLERHALEQVPEVFGKVPLGRRNRS
jgi:hypothetical protein